MCQAFRIKIDKKKLKEMYEDFDSMREFKKYLRDEYGLYHEESNIFRDREFSIVTELDPDEYEVLEEI